MFDYRVIVLILTTLNGIFCETPLIELPIGKVSGIIEKTIDGKDYYAFRGVPYAKPPINELRFEPPEENNGWNGTLEANKVHICLQYNHAYNDDDEKIIGEEDCLYLNIFTPTLDKTAKYDVIFYIHGGAFMFNYGGIYGADKLLTNNLVFITFNYRLGPLGFLSTEDDVVPGNMGLKDQIAALKWVKKYISYFGGNPESITIAGNSAGAASVHLHSLMPASEGLYHRAISQSGCALNPWVLMEQPLETTRKVATIVNCATQKTSKALIECLKKVEGRKLVETVKEFQPWLYNPFSPFGVVVDSFSKSPLLPQHPYILLKNGKFINHVPWLISFTSSEGLYPAGEFYTEERLNYIENNWNFVMPHILHYNFTVDADKMDGVSEEIRQHYFHGEKLTKTTYKNLIQMVSDRLFRSDIQKAIKLYPKTEKVFVQMFDYRGKHSYSEKRAKTDENLGVSHVDDLSYILNIGLDTYSDPVDRYISDVMIHLWVTFAKKGVPEFQKFIPYPSTEYYYRISGPSNINPEVIVDFGEQAFWDSLPIKENEKITETRKILEEL